MSKKKSAPKEENAVKDEEVIKDPIPQGETVKSKVPVYNVKFIVCGQKYVGCKNANGTYSDQNGVTYNSVELC